jgi:hypothetical protein
MIPINFKHSSGRKNPMRSHFKRHVNSAMTLLLVLIVSVTPLFAQQAGRGNAPRGNAAPAQNGTEAGSRGNRGNNNEAAQARQQIQATRKAAIEQANEMYRLTMTTAQHDAKSEDAGARARAQSEIQSAQSSRKAAIERANANAKAAMAALNTK